MPIYTYYTYFSRVCRVKNYFPAVYYTMQGSEVDSVVFRRRIRSILIIFLYRNPRSAVRSYNIILCTIDGDKLVCSSAIVCSTYNIPAVAVYSVSKRWFVSHLSSTTTSILSDEMSSAWIFFQLIPSCERFLYILRPNI